MREHEIPETTMNMQEKGLSDERDTWCKTKSEGRYVFSEFKKTNKQTRNLLVAFVSLKVTDLSSMLHTLRTDTWQV